MHSRVIGLIWQGGVPQASGRGICTKYWAVRKERPDKGELSLSLSRSLPKHEGDEGHIYGQEVCMHERVPDNCMGFRPLGKSCIFRWASNDTKGDFPQLLVSLCAAFCKGSHSRAFVHVEPSTELDAITSAG